MASQSTTRRTALKDAASSAHGEDDTAPRQKLKRRATVYDAVAGRVTREGLSLRNHQGENTKIISAIQLMFQRKAAPPMYEEKASDYYHADTFPPELIPDSDLCKAIHTYASDYYSRTSGLRVPRQLRQNPDFLQTKMELARNKAYKSMDGTALLAMGVLLEEMMRESLGATGDLSFTEGVTQEPNDQKKKRKRQARRSQSTTEQSQDQDQEALPDTEVEHTKKNKRRKSSRKGKEPA